MSDALTARVDAWAVANEATRSEAIRRLVELGLTVKGEAKPCTAVRAGVRPIKHQAWPGPRSTSFLTSPPQRKSKQNGSADSLEDLRNFGTFAIAQFGRETRDRRRQPAAALKSGREN
jgi:hypothetical protein